ncbi:MAG: chemotaxis protein CheB [Thiotrichales bacterium]
MTEHLDTADEHDPTEQVAASVHADGAAPGRPHDMVIVGIGSSAGGLEALRALVPTLPIQPDLTYVLAQHMDPKHSSMLGPILEREAHMPVLELRHGQTLKSGVIHIIPPGMDAMIEHNRIILVPATSIGPKPSIDRFFASLAKHQGERVVGIILSGTGMDGAHGMRAIKAEGGITIAQEEATAKFSGMPHAAIGTGHVDLILAPEKVGAQLPELIRYPRVIPAVEGDERPPDNLNKILRLVMDQTGGDFRNYKQSTVRRRIERRMAVNKLHTPDEYIALLEQNPAERYELHKDLLISVTDFFRDAEAFRDLASIVHKIVADDGGKEDVRIWIPGCATGEEAYSIAMLLSEHLGKRISRYNIHVFASDLDEDALAVARQGVYPKAAVSAIPKKLLNDYFTRQNDTYKLVPAIRDMILFARHDLVKDPPFSHLDMISCRNVLIYFNIALQKRILQAFHYALETNGVLFLGKSETTGAAERLFLPLLRASRIYQRNGDVKAHLPHLTAARGERHPVEGHYLPGAEKKVTPYDVLKQSILDLYRPACVMLDDRLDVTYVRGDVSTYLKLPEGRAALNVLDLVRNEFRHDLRGLLYRARREGDAVRSRRFRIGLDEKNFMEVTMAALYLGKTASASEKFVLVFERGAIEEQTVADAASVVDARRIRELEDQLRETRESLQTTIEELETANEELQSTYEEAQSTNEELFTSTEELQTANEELQSTNEELRTVNEELGVKSHEVEVTNEKLKKTNQRLSEEIAVRKKTEQRLEEQQRRLRAIISSEPAWVNLCRSDGTILEVNPAGLGIMEADSERQLIGKRLDDFLAQGQDETLRTCREHLQENQTSRTLIEVRTLRGTPRWLEVSSALLPGSESDAAHMLSIVVDQTDRIDAQQSLLQRQNELAQLMRLNTLGEMASGLTHELNQPLSAISNYLSGCERRLQADNCDRAEVMGVLRMASIQARRAGEIVNQMKRFIRHEDVEYIAIDINEVIRSAVGLIKAAAEEGSIRIVQKLDGRLPPLLANRVQIEQVMINLLRNAVEAATSAQTEKPVITVRSRLAKPDTLNVGIDDNGPGLPDTEALDIFKPFCTTKAQGMGMGLSISRSIIETHAGTLTGKNRRGGGATFSFTLPIQREQVHV